MSATRTSNSLLGEPIQEGGGGDDGHEGSGSLQHGFVHVPGPNITCQPCGNASSLRLIGPWFVCQSWSIIWAGWQPTITPNRFGGGQSSAADLPG